VDCPHPSPSPFLTKSPGARRVAFKSPVVDGIISVPARCRCRLGRFQLRLKGNLLLLRKESFEIEASYQLLPWRAPTPWRAVVDTGAGSSVVRADMLPEGCMKYAARAPPDTC